MMNSVPDIVYLRPNLDLVPSEDLWHALASRYDAAVFAGVRDLYEGAEDVDCASAGSPVGQHGLLPYLTLYVDAHTCDDDADKDEG
jgi:hypothetical protein